MCGSCPLFTLRLHVVDLADIVSELPALRMLNASEAVRDDPKIEIKSFIEQLSCEGDRPDLEIILGGITAEILIVEFII